MNKPKYIIDRDNTELHALSNKTEFLWLEDARIKTNK
jgi:hypothetical protein